MGYLIPVTPQAFVNRISINRPDEANIKEISYQLFEHLTINNRHFNTTSNLELYLQLEYSRKRYDSSLPFFKLSLHT